MGLIIAAAAGLLGFLLAVQPLRPGSVPPPRPYRAFALALAVYLIAAGLIFVPLVLGKCGADAARCLAARDRELSIYVVATLATACGIGGAFAARKPGVQRWLLVAWPVPLAVATLMTKLGG